MNSTKDPKIEGALNQVAKISYTIKSEHDSMQDIIDKALDELLLFKQLIEKKTRELKAANELLRVLTWIDEPHNEEILVQINVVEVLTKELNKRIQSEIKRIKKTKLPEICPSFLGLYFSEAECFEENIELIHQIFFELRNDEEFLDMVNQT